MLMNNLYKKYKKVAILGIGTEGLALTDFLFDKAEKITILDKMPEEKIAERLQGEELTQFKRVLADDNMAKVFGENYLDNLSDFDTIFRSPGISACNQKIREAKEAGAEISSQLKLFFDLCPCPIIGVTGTKGKGTTASLISEMLKKQHADNSIQITENRPQVYLAGNIGYPAITLIPEIKEDDIVILELSSFQLMDLEKSPHIAVVTNLSEDHLDYHADVEEYRGAKFNILKYQSKNDFAVLNKKSTFANELLDQIVSTKKYFSSTDSGSDAAVRKIENEDWVILDPENRNIKICRSSDIILFGRHNLENIAAAALVADIMGAGSKEISAAAREFAGLSHRIEFVAEIDGVKYINDSYATNPEPTMAAIRSFLEPKILILGGSSKGADFSALARIISSSDAPAVVLIDPEGQKIKQSLVDNSYKGKVLEGGKDIKEIVGQAKAEAKPGDVVLMSPACASFGMFKNYKDRGEEFKAAVLNLASNLE